MTFSPDSRVAVSTGDDGLAIVWDPQTGTVLQRLTGHSNTRVFAADFSPDSKTLYTPGIDGAILQYDLGTNRRFGSPFSVGVGLPRGNTIIMPPLLAASPDGRTLAASVEQSAVNFFSTSTLRRVARISLAAGPERLPGSMGGQRSVRRRRRPGPRPGLGSRPEAEIGRSPARTLEAAHDPIDRLR